MQSAKCKVQSGGVVGRETRPLRNLSMGNVGALIKRPRAISDRPYNSIIAEGNTCILHLAFCILHFDYTIIIGKIQEKFPYSQIWGYQFTIYSPQMVKMWYHKKKEI